MSLLLLSRRKIGKGRRELDKGHEAEREGWVNSGRVAAAAPEWADGQTSLVPKALQNWDQDGERHQ